jgi:hypothetical protein
VSEVADFNKARLKRAGVPETGAQPCTILECATCKAVAFCLEENGIVFCFNCKIQIGSLRWFDQTKPHTV